MNKLALILCLFCAPVFAQVTQQIPTGTVLGNSSGATAAPSAVAASTAAAMSGYITFPKPAVTDSTPIIQNVRMGFTATAFPGQYFTDPVSGWGYNYCVSGGAIQAPCNSTDPWAQGIDNENDYNFPTSYGEYTANSSTTATVAAFTGTQTYLGTAWTANQFQDWVLCDGGTAYANCFSGTGIVGTSLITANTVGTAATITVSPAITGMASGDHLVLVMRQTENRWGAYVGGHRWPVYTWNADKGTSLATGTLYLRNNEIAVPTMPCYGLEFVPDYLTDVAGSGNDDLATLSDCGNNGVVFNLMPTNGISPTLTLQGSENQMEWYGGTGVLGQYWVNGAAHRGDMTFYAYSTAGTLYHTLEWDPNGPTYKFGDTSGVFTSYIFQGSGNVVSGGPIVTAGYAIASLPTCNSGEEGATAYVTNGQTTPTYLGAVSTTGTTVAPVFCNGSGWVYH